MAAPGQLAGARDNYQQSPRLVSVRRPKPAESWRVPFFACCRAADIRLRAQRASAIHRRKEIWEALHPNSGADCAAIPERGRGRPQEFASETAEVSGESKSQINRHVARAEALGPDIHAVVGTSLDKGVELDALKGMDADERRELIERAQSGEQVSARAGNDDHDPARIKRLVTQAIGELARLAKQASAAKNYDMTMTQWVFAGFRGLKNKAPR